MSDGFNPFRLEELRFRAAIEEVEYLHRQLAEVRAVLDDVLNERGQSWLAQLAKRRAQVAVQLRYAERLGDYEVCGSCHDLDAQYDDGFHVAKCPLAELLRIVGGPEETQRQVDAAHEEAMIRLVTFDEAAKYPGAHIVGFDMPTYEPRPARTIHVNGIDIADMRTEEEVERDQSDRAGTGK